MRDGYGWRVFVLKSASFAKGYRFSDSTQLMYVRSVTRVFHTCGKNCGNSPRNGVLAAQFAPESCGIGIFPIGESSTKLCNFEPK
jgi:hypothetical protein